MNTTPMTGPVLGLIWSVCAAMLITAAGCDGCGGEEKPADIDQAGQTTGADESSADGGQPATEEPSTRRIFGLPLPGGVSRIERSPDRVRVRTTRSIGELDDFFEARLTDYEILRPAGRLRVVGLREYMPRIYAYGVGSTTYVVYQPATGPVDGEPTTSGGADAGQTARSADHTRRRAPHKHVAGQRVLERTSDGKLLAPGARWGQPYTPPKGSPLDKKHFKSNFGRPYGQWQLR